MNKNSIGGTKGKNLKKIIDLFFLKSDGYFFQIFPYGPPHEIFFHPLVPQRKQEKLAKMSLWPKCLWPKCHSGQSVSLAKVSLWPKCHSGQSVTGQTVSPAKLSLAKVSLAKRSLWPNCQSGQSVLAKVSLAKVSFWPKCDSAMLTAAAAVMCLDTNCVFSHPQKSLTDPDKCYQRVTHNHWPYTGLA